MCPPTWQLVRNLDTLNQWCLHHILQISLSASISNEEVTKTLTSHHSHTSVLLVWSSLATLLMLTHPWTTVKPFGQCGPFAKGLELPIGLTMPQLAPDHWIRSGTTQYWSGNCLSSSAESTSMEHARRNGDVHCRTSHMMMNMQLDVNAVNWNVYTHKESCF